jgi:hypothetical protein
MKKAAIGTAAVVIAGAAIAVFVLEPSPRTTVVSAQPTALPAESRAALLPSGLPERQSLSGSRTDVFAAAPWAQPPVAPKPKPVVQESASAGVSAPPVPYRFVGTVKHGGEVVYALAKGDSVFPITAGDTIEGIYRVEAITPQIVTLVYLPLEERIMLVLATPPRDGANAPRPGMPGQNFPVITPPSSPVQAGAPVEEARPPAMRAAQMRGQRNPH